MNTSNDFINNQILPKLTAKNFQQIFGDLPTYRNIDNSLVLRCSDDDTKVIFTHQSKNCLCSKCGKNLLLAYYANYYNLDEKYVIKILFQQLKIPLSPEVILDIFDSGKPTLGQLVPLLTRMHEIPVSMMRSGLTDQDLMISNNLCFYTDSEKLISDIEFIRSNYCRNKYWKMNDRVKFLLRNYQNKPVVCEMRNSTLYMIDLSGQISHDVPYLRGRYFDKQQKSCFISDDSVFINLCWANRKNAIYLNPRMAITPDTVFELNTLWDEGSDVYIVSGREKICTLNICDQQKVFYEKSLPQHQKDCYLLLKKLFV